MTDTNERRYIKIIRDVATVKLTEGSMPWTPTYKREWKSYNGTTPIGSSGKRKPLNTTPEPLPSFKPKVLVHQEREFTFSSGETIRSCPVEFCPFGKPTKSGYRRKHSNGETFIPTFEDDIPTVVETDDGEGVQVSEDDPQELSPIADLINITANELGLPAEDELEDAGTQDAGTEVDEEAS